MKFAQEPAFQPQLPGSRTRQRRDRGASHHGELAARRPGTPEPGMGQEAPARGTHLGRAAEARGGEGGRGSRHVASSDCPPLSVNPGWGRWSEGPRKTFFQVALGAAKLFVAGLLWLPAVGSQRVGSSALGGAALGGDPSLPAGTVGQRRCPCGPARRGGDRGSAARQPARRAPSPARPSLPSPPAGTGAGCLPASPPPCAARSCPAWQPHAGGGGAGRTKAGGGAR